jgi:uroporphyrinogen decarboxylase
MAKCMNSKERVATTFAHQEPDRVPVNYLSNPGIDGRLKVHFSLDADDHIGLLEALEVDFRGCGAPYAGPKLFPDMPDRMICEWGIHRRWAEHESGGYWDFCDFPLQDATLADIEAWPMPSPDHYDYSQISELCRCFADYYIVAGGAGIGDIINSTGMLFNMEEVLVRLMTDDEAVLRYVERRNAVLLEVMARTLEAGEGNIDALWMGEDLGTQHTPLISLDLYRTHLRPIHQRYIDLANSWNIPVMVHSCGSSSWVYDDFIEMGVSVVDTLQPEAKDMSPAYLKSRYGDKLAFHGCISTAGPLAYGTADDVQREVRETLEIMMPGGGYALAPTHQIQDNSPVENVLAMYEAARAFGRYPAYCG